MKVAKGLLSVSLGVNTARSVMLDWVALGQVMLGRIMLCRVGLGWVRLGASGWLG